MRETFKEQWTWGTVLEPQQIAEEYDMLVLFTKIQSVSSYF